MALPGARRAGGRMIAAMSLLSVPWLTQRAGIAYDEGGFLLFGILSIGWLRRFSGTDAGSEVRRRTRSNVEESGSSDTSKPASAASTSVMKQTFDSCYRVRDFAFAGAMAGFAAGSKLTAVPEVLLAVPLGVRNRGRCGERRCDRIVVLRRGRASHYSDRRSPYIQPVAYSQPGVDR